MKNCPICNSEVEDNFQLCWNCNYSFTEKKIAAIKNINDGNRELNCLRCNIPLIFSGNYKFHEGTRTGVFFVNRAKFDLYKCPKCGKVEFFAPLNN